MRLRRGGCWKGVWGMGALKRMRRGRQYEVTQVKVVLHVTLRTGIESQLLRAAYQLTALFRSWNTYKHLIMYNIYSTRFCNLAPVNYLLRLGFRRKDQPNRPHIEDCRVLLVILG